MHARRTYVSRKSQNQSDDWLNWLTENSIFYQIYSLFFLLLFTYHKRLNFTHFWSCLKESVPKYSSPRIEKLEKLCHLGISLNRI